MHHAKVKEVLIMAQFFIILQQLFVFAFFVAIGILCVKCKIFDESSLNSISKFIINVSMPIMLVCNLLAGPSLGDLIAASPIFIVYLASFVLLYLSNCVIVRFFNFDPQKANIYKAMATFSNAGFIGIPLILALYGKEGGIFMSLCVVVDQFMLWTLGVKLASNLNAYNFKCLKNFINPALLAIIFSLTAVALGLKLPKMMFLALAPLGNMTPALSMIYIGGLFCFFNIKKYLINFEVYILILFKMILFPVSVWSVLKFTPIAENIAKTVVLLCALPSMSAIAILAKKYNNNAEYAIATLLITSACSLVTVPLVSFLMSII